MGHVLDDQTSSGKPQPMYRIIGADQKEYGPVTAEELRGWIAEGRANGQTLAQIEGGAWKPLSTYPEFTQALNALPGPPSFVPTAVSVGPRPTNGMAIASLILGLFSVTVGLLCCGPLFAILGIIFGAVALAQIKKTQQSGRGMAITGVALSVCGLIFSLAFLMAFGLLHRITEAVKSGRP